jgi:hypothetical protein
VTWGAIAEVAVGLAMLAGAVLLYRRRSPDDGSYGSQGAVILLAVAAILLIHGLGGLDYRPSQAELEAAAAR